MNYLGGNSVGSSGEQLGEASGLEAGFCETEGSLKGEIKKS